MSKIKLNKSEQVRSVLREIGADVKNPPENWRASCERLLRERGVDVKPIIIYQQRTIMLRKKLADAKNRRSSGEQVSLKELVMVKSLSLQLGGLEKLRKVVDVLQELTG